MAKFNVVQKKRRECVRQRKRAIHGDPLTGKLKTRSQPLSVSGKRQRKLLKKWRRDQKEAVEKGLVSMDDVEIAAAEGEASSKNAHKTTAKFNMKKGVKLKRNGKQKGKKSKATAEATTQDAMLE